MADVKHIKSQDEDKPVVYGQRGLMFQISALGMNILVNNKKLYPALAEHLYIFESKRRLLPASLSLNSS
ncbi:unnamed protein product [Brassica oleracea]